MAEVLFYHLERTPLERVLPGLLEKTVQRGWRAVVQASSAERVAALDTLLWTYRDEAFLPHGTAGEDNAALQPIFLTADRDNPNGASVRFLVDGADLDDPAEIGAYERVVFLFDGNDPDAIAGARERWKAARAAGLEVTYWQQDEHGKWQRRG